MSEMTFSSNRAMRGKDVFLNSLSAPLRETATKWRCGFSDDWDGDESMVMNDLLSGCDLVEFIVLVNEVNVMYL